MLHYPLVNHKVLTKLRKSFCWGFPLLKTYAWGTKKVSKKLREMIQRSVFRHLRQLCTLRRNLHACVRSGIQHHYFFYFQKQWNTSMKNTSLSSSLSSCTVKINMLVLRTISKWHVFGWCLCGVPVIQWPLNQSFIKRVLF